MVTQINLDRLSASGATLQTHVIKWNGNNWAFGVLSSTDITNFNEAAQDAIGLMVEANSLVYDDNAPLLSVKRQMSITADASGLKFVNDSATPGNNKIYGTDGSGTKGWYNSPSGADGNGIYTGSGTIGNNANNSTTNATLPSGNSSLDFRYFGNTTGISIQGNGTNSGNVILNNLANTYGIQLHDLDMTFIYPNGSTSFNGNELAIVDTNVFIDTAGGSADAKALLEISSTTKAFLPPRFTTGEYNTYIGTPTTEGMLLYNKGTHTLKMYNGTLWVDISDSSNSVTASNGLTKTGNDIKWGGVLVEDTTISNADSFKIIFSGSKTGNNYLLTVNNTSNTTGGGIQGTSAGSGAGIQGLANGTGAGVSGYAVGGGSGVTGQSESGGIAGWFTTENTTDNSVLTGLSIIRNVTSGVGAVGAGVRLEFGIESSSTSGRRSNAIVSEWTTATDLTRSSKLSITTVNSGTEATKLELSAAGQLKLNSYGVNNFTGTATKTLQVDANGNVIEGALTPPAGSGGIYGGSGTIPNGTVATLTASGTFTFDYAGGNDAIVFNDSTPSLTLKSKNGTYSVGINNTGITLVSNTNNVNLTVNSSGTRIAYNDGGSAPQVFTVDSTGAYLTSTTKMLIPPVMTTGQRTGGTLTETGGIVYDSDFQRIFLRVPGSFKRLLVDGSGEGGIYSGSGNVPNGTNATVANNGTFNFKYNNGNAAFGVQDSTGLTGIYSRDATAEIKAWNGNINAIVSSEGLYITNTTSQISNNLDVAQTIQYSVALVPAQITANQNNYAPAGHASSSTWNISSDAARNITGIANPTAGRILILHNVGTFTITLKNEDAASNAANRFSFGVDIPIPAKSSVHLIYDDDNDRWRCVGGGLATPHSGSGGIYSGDGTIATGCDATVTDGSYFRIKYSTGGNGAIQVNSIAGSENTIIRGKSPNYGNLEVTNTTAKITAGSSGQGITVSEKVSIFNSETNQFGQKILWTSIDTPAAFNVAQNNFDSGTATILRMETTVNNTQVTGMTHGAGLGNFGDADGRMIIIMNISATNGIMFMGNNAGSDAEYRFLVTWTLAPSSMAIIVYDATSQRWRHLM